MRFDLSRTVSKLHAKWGDVLYRNNPDDKNRVYLVGAKGSGKTAVAQAYVDKYPKTAMYFSFAHMDNNAALKAINTIFLGGESAPISWEEAGELFLSRYKRKTLLVLLDDLEDFPGEKDFEIACERYMARNRIIVAKLLRRISSGLRNVADLPYRSIADYCKLLPYYPKEDVVRLYALTAGIPAILEELDETRSFDNNLSRLLRYDSVFSRFLPEWMSEYFRAPESYYPILRSIAFGRHRLSEIGRDVGLPNNQCQNYLRALYGAGIVRIQGCRRDGYAQRHRRGPVQNRRRQYA